MAFKNNNIIHFLYVPFTGLGLYQGYRGDTWLKNRIKVFKSFVIPSLMNQTKREFIVWVSWRPEDRANQTVEDFIRSLDQLRGMQFVHTFGGVCFWDDKYPSEIARARLKESLERTLPDLRSLVPDDTDYVLMTIQPSDDMYLGGVVEQIQSFPYKEKRVLGYTKGYIMRYDTLEISEYDPTTVPPFFTIMFPPKVFLDPKAHLDYTGPYESHEYVKDTMEWVSIPERGFVVGTHGENISTGWNHGFRGRALEDEEKDRVLIQTGNFFAEPVELRKDLRRRVMKRVLNLLPRGGQRAVVRLLSPGVTDSIKSYTWFSL